MKIVATIKPNSKIDSVQKIGDEFVVRVKEQAVEGKANEAAVKLVAEYFDVPKTCVQIVRGATSRYKVIEVAI